MERNHGMLVLSRKLDEQIIITINNQPVRVKVLSIDGNKVRLGISAPDSITVHREEVWKRQAEFAAETAPTPTATV
jgi:carbon storage regulator